MIYAFLGGLVLLLMVIGISNTYDASKLPFLKKVLKVFIIFALIFGLVFLVVTGRLSAIYAILGGLTIWLIRLLQLGILYKNFKEVFKFKEKVSKDSDMDIKEAYEILGLKPGATKEEINKAYKDLMSKLHPDHGGNEYFAMRLNLAKDILLKKK